MIWSVCKRCRKRFTARSENWLCRQCDECSNEPLFENDFVLAKVLPGVVLNNTATRVTTATSVVDVLWFFAAILLILWFISQ
jgi:hypothetical protein